MQDEQYLQWFFRGDKGAETIELFAGGHPVSSPDGPIVLRNAEAARDLAIVLLTQSVRLAQRTGLINEEGYWPEPHEAAGV